MYEYVFHHPALVNREPLLLLDNVPPYTFRRTRAKIDKLETIKLLPHFSWSPDLGPRDYYLFHSMPHLMCGRHFENIEQVERDL